MYCPCSKNKGTDQLRSYCEADLCLCFRIGKYPVFSRCGSSMVVKYKVQCMCNFVLVKQLVFYLFSMNSVSLESQNLSCNPTIACHGSFVAIISQHDIKKKRKKNDNNNKKKKKIRNKSLKCADRSFYAMVLLYAKFEQCNKSVSERACL